MQEGINQCGGKITLPRALVPVGRALPGNTDMGSKILMEEERLFESKKKHQWVCNKQYLRNCTILQHDFAITIIDEIALTHSK